MARNAQPVTQARTFAWLHGDPPPIVYYTLRTVDGARLAYTRAQLDRHEARGKIIMLDNIVELPKAAGY